jgi:hypothetical protein
MRLCARSSAQRSSRATACLPRRCSYGAMALPFWVRHFWSQRTAMGGSIPLVDLMEERRCKCAGAFPSHVISAASASQRLCQLLKQDGLAVLFQRSGMADEDQALCDTLLADPQRQVPVSSGKPGERRELHDFFSGPPLCAATAGLMGETDAGRAWLAAFKCFGDRHRPYEPEGYMLTSDQNFTFFHSHAACVLNTLLVSDRSRNASKFVLMIPYDIGVAHSMMPVEGQRVPCEDPGLSPLGLTLDELRRCSWAHVKAEEGNALLWAPGTFHAIWTEVTPPPGRETRPAPTNQMTKLHSSGEVRASTDGSCGGARSIWARHAWIGYSVYVLPNDAVLLDRTLRILRERRPEELEQFDDEAEFDRVIVHVAACLERCTAAVTTSIAADSTAEDGERHRTKRHRAELDQ